MTSLRPNPARPAPQVSLRLTISPSVSDPKNLLGAVISAFLALDSPSEVDLNNPVRQLVKTKNEGLQEKDRIEFKPELLSAMFEFFEPELQKQNISFDSFSAVLGKNALLELQIEPLQVALELVWTLASIELSGGSTERTAYNRYPKILRYTANADIVGALVKANLEEFRVVLLNWIGFEDFLVDQHYEFLLRQTLTAFVEPSLFQVRGKSEEIVFHQLGVYEQLLSTNNPHVEGVDLHNEGGKGTFRVFGSSFTNGIHAYLRGKSTKAATLSDDRSVEEFANYTARVRESLRWANKNIATETSQTVSLLESDGTEIQLQVKLPRNTIFYGVPGSGKSFTIKSLVGESTENVSRVVFHADYTYGDFVGQILPKTSGDRVTYGFAPGPLVTTMEKALSTPDRNFYLIIEEINRANAPSVFGDIFQLLDRKETGRSEFSIHNAAVAEYLHNDPDAPIYLPSNLFLIGTMNTADQNVFTLDTAFQRRWAQHMITNDVSESKYASARILDTSITWSRFVESANELIAERVRHGQVSEDKQIGAYFVSEEILKYTPVSDTVNEQAAMFANSLFGETVLKYLWDDAFRFDRDAIFNKGYSTLQGVLTTFNSEHGNERFYVFSDKFLDKVGFADALQAQVDQNDASAQNG